MPKPYIDDDMHQCEFCGYLFEYDLCPYGCPNCLGEGLDDPDDPPKRRTTPMRSALMILVGVVLGVLLVQAIKGSILAAVLGGLLLLGVHLVLDS